MTFFVLTLFSVQTSHTASDDFIPVPLLTPSEQAHLDQILSENYTFSRAQELFDFFVEQQKDFGKKIFPYLDDISAADTLELKNSIFNFVAVGFRVTSIFGLLQRQRTLYHQFKEICAFIPQSESQEPNIAPTLMGDDSLMIMLCAEVYICAMAILAKPFPSPIGEFLTDFIQTHLLEISTHCVAIECFIPVDTLQFLYATTCRYHQNCIHKTCQGIRSNLEQLRTMQEEVLYNKLAKSSALAERQCGVLRNVIGEHTQRKRVQITGGRAFTDDVAPELEQLHADEEALLQLITPLHALYTEIKLFLEHSEINPHKRQRT
jgi:hypothetical protein